MFILLSHLRVSNVFDAVLRNKQNLPITGEKEEETIQRLKYLNKVVCIFLLEKILPVNVVILQNQHS